MANLPLTEIAVPDTDDIFVIGEQERADIVTLQNGLAALEDEVEAIPTMTLPELAAGAIISDKYSEDEVPYLFRAVKYNSRRLEESIVGGSVVWNQLINTSTITSTHTTNGVTFTNNGDGSISVSNTANADGLSPLTSNVTFTQGNKYYLYSGIKNLSFVYDGYTNDGADTGNGTILTWSRTSGVSYLYANVINGTAYNETIKPILVDLTQMFGSTIADYVYTLESGTAGAGVAWLKSHGFFTEPYYAYDTGTLKSVQATKHVTVGINQWDEIAEGGAINTSTGANTTSSTQIRSKNYIDVIPNTVYYAKVGANDGSLNLFYYDANKNYIGWEGSSKRNTTITTPSNARYMRFSCTSNYGTTYNNDICINLSDPTINGEYYPYEKHEYALGNVTLRGLPKLDASNNLYYDGDTYESDGDVTRKYGVVDLGTLSWSKYSSSPHDRFGSESLASVIKKATSDGTIANILCPNYITDTSTNVYNHVTDKTIAVDATNGRVYVYDTAYSSSTDFKTAMNGVYLVYELATPTTETSDTFEKYQICNPKGTEEYITLNDVPVGHNTKYFEDVIGNIENIPQPPTANGTYTLKCTVSSGVATYAWV